MGIPMRPFRIERNCGIVSEWNETGCFRWTVASMQTFLR